MFILQVVCIVILVYGLLSLVQDISNEITYKRICHDLKIVVFAKKLEENLDKFIIELYQMKKVNCYKQFTIIDLDENADTSNIEMRIINNEINGKVLNIKEGGEFINNLLQNKY